MSVNNKKVVILGAGLAGLSAAWHLQEKALDCSVFEKDHAVGGLCKSRKLKGFSFDCDGHLLHFRDKYIFRLVKRLLNGNIVSHKRSAWISNFGIFSPYPFQANLYSLPDNIGQECLLGFLKAVQSGERGALNFREWIDQSFGAGIARHFMLPYNDKFWTVPLEEMIYTWTGNFIPQPKPSEVIKGFFGKNKGRFGYNSEFWYPRSGGIEQLPLAFERGLKNVFKECKVDSVDLQRKELVARGKGKIKFDLLISTIPLPELAKILNPLPRRLSVAFNKLRWNSIFNLNIGVKRKCQPGRHWIYFPHKSTSFFRAGFFHNFSHSAAPAGKGAVYAEVAYSKRRPLDKKNITKRVIKDLVSSGILGRDNKISVLDINDIKYGYPVYDENYPEATAVIKEFLTGNDVISCGRYGSWRYMSMEDAMLDGKHAAEAVSNEKSA
ncbi:MAG: FAD-dependent oxidoreductase [Candidatus Omnitrophica bacterium]|nr:FAD-dependent oxidoreductase [Candidatus Omnitrophota bacterium]MDD5501592.1 FAD-dependent oxidoreductase [Candidatus Omnitrophota bacterium]